VAGSAATTWFLPLSRALPWLGGPILDKELRVSSRQRKSYILRFAYVSLLTIFVAGVWFGSAPGGSPGSAVYQASRMGVAGRYTAMTIVWFQFCAAQILAVVLLVKALDKEIRKRTLHVLAVTPLSSLQIVWGKLAGGLLPIIMLLATSLPLLAIIRVLGGVSWDYVLSGVCITFTATLFIGVLGLVPSAPYGSAFAAVLPGVWYMIVTRLMDALINWLAHFVPAVGTIGMPVLRRISPTDVLLVRTQEMLAAQPGAGLSAWWPVHCLILLGGSVAVALWTARHVRTIVAAAPPDPTREGLMYRLGAWAGSRRMGTKGALGHRSQRTTPIRRVQGSPIVWKELLKSWTWRNKPPLARYTQALGATLVFVVVLLGVVALTEGSLRLSAMVPMLVGWTFSLQGGLIMGLAVAAAGAISKEREARTLPFLLTIPWEDREIVRDEAIAVWRRGLFFLAPLSVFTSLLLITVLAFVTKATARAILWGAGLYLVALLGIMPFLVGLGLYLGARLKTIAGATACMFVLLFGLILAGAATVIPVLRRGSLVVPERWLAASVVTILVAFALAGAAWILLWAASRRLRRNIF
jgi:ABC-type transport system involved in multi-copper enzyme maturation permease subunit